MTPDQLQDTLRLHALWLSGDPQGARADLRGANLRGAVLSHADLSRADLRRAKGIVFFGPVGTQRRIGCATSAGVQLGCFWGTVEEACTAIAKKYGEGSSYEALVRAAVRELESKK